MLDLDLHYHLHRKTGEVMRILDRGTSAIQNILSTVIFAIGPQVRVLPALFKRPGTPLPLPRRPAGH